MMVCRDLERWRLRWFPFEKLVRDAAVAAGGGEVSGVEEDPFADGTDDPHDVRPLSADVYVKCFVCGKTSSWNYGASAPVGGWGDLFPTQVRLAGRNDKCSHMRAVKG